MSDWAIPRFSARADAVPRGPEPVAAPPVAAFTYTKNGLTVQFTDQSTDADGVIVQWTWDFGDEPTLPVADFTFSASGLVVTFTDKSSDPDGVIVFRRWDFGDGTQSTLFNPSHTYAAAGSYTVTLLVVDDNGHEATASRVVATVSGAGIPFGPFSLFTGASSIETVGTQHFTLGMQSTTPDNLIERLNFCRARGLKLMTNLTGGAHTKYKTNDNFDPAKYKAAADAYNTAAIKNAEVQAVRDGVWIGNVLMDEPANTTPENGWGTYFQSNGKAKVDALATYFKGILPNVPHGVTLDQSIWADQSFTVVDFIVSQYRLVKGGVTGYRDAALALGARDRHAVVFSINIIHGGEPGGPSWSCPLTTTGGRGKTTGLCKVTALQLQDWGIILGGAGAALLLWEYDLEMFSQAQYVNAAAAVAANLAGRPKKSFRRF